MTRLVAGIMKHDFSHFKMRRLIIKLSLALLILGLCAFSVLAAYSTLFLWAVRVPTGAMANTIIPGDRLLVDKRTAGEIKRGEILIFKYPKDPSANFVFRVVALPSETIQVRGRIIYINDRELMEERVTVKPDVANSAVLQEVSSEGSGSYRVFHGSHESSITSESEVVFGGSQPFRVPENHYFMMGDNRDNSHDSRFWGPVPRESILGKPFMIYWSSDESGDEEVRWERILTKLR